MPQLVHADVPLVDQAEDELGTTSPTVRVAVTVRLRAKQHALRAQVFDDRLGNLLHLHACQPVEAIDVYPAFVEWRYGAQVEFLPEEKILFAAARRDVDDAGALLLANFGPRDDAVLGAANGGQLVERAHVAPLEHLGTAHVLLDLPACAEHLLHQWFGQIDALAILDGARIGQVRMHRGGHVRGQRPRRGRPHQQAFVSAAHQRKAHERAGVGDLGVTLGLDLHVADAGATARAPRHDVVAAIQPAALVAGLDHPPDRVVDLVRHREVRVAPVHPLPQAAALLTHDPRELQHAVLAALDKAGDAVLLDVALGAEAELLLDFDLHPQPLAIEAVLPALVVAGHRLVALEQILVRASPGVVHRHRVVGRDRSVDEREAFFGAGELLAEGFEGGGLLPEVQHAPLEGWKVGLIRDRLIHNGVDVSRMLTQPSGCPGKAAENLD